MQTGVKNDEGVEHGPAPNSHKESRSQHHVELVIARILAKQRVDAKERRFRSIDWEHADTNGRWH